MSRSVLITLILVVLSGLISGCQSAAIQPADPVQVSVADIHARDAKLNALTRFQVSGGLGIWTDEQSVSARVIWVQSPQSLQIKLTGPLGIGDMQLLDSGTQVSLTRGNQVVNSGTSADVVLQQGLGLEAPVPLQQLGFWVKGLPGDATSVERDNQGKLSFLRFTDEQGTRWQARFRRYTSLDDLLVPALITASGGPYSVRLLLKNWQSSSSSVVPEVPESNKRLSIPDR